MRVSLKETLSFGGPRIIQETNGAQNSKTDVNFDDGSREALACVLIRI